MHKWAHLWETWLDKLTWGGIVIILASMVFMFHSHRQEARATGVVSIPAFQEVTASHNLPQRSPAIQTALDKSKSLLEAEDYSRAISVAQGIIQQDPKESFAYVYLARAKLANNELGESIRNYALAVKLNPDFVDKKSPDKIGPELKTLVRDAVIETRKAAFKQRPGYKKSIKALYYLQRRLAGGCE